VVVLLVRLHRVALDRLLAHEALLDHFLETSRRLSSEGWIKTRNFEWNPESFGDFYHFNFFSTCISLLSSSSITDCTSRPLPSSPTRTNVVEREIY
jgi:hypothetical protein